MVHIDIIYKGNLRCTSIHQPSNCQLITDAPVDNHGKGESFSPTDLVATALGSCMATIMGIVADRDGLDLSGMTISVDKDMVADPHRRIGTLFVKITAKGIDKIHHEKLRNAALSCPVAQSINPKIKVDLTMEWL